MNFASKWEKIEYYINEHKGEILLNQKIRHTLTMMENMSQKLFMMVE